jgi:hypothetical protein
MNLTHVGYQQCLWRWKSVSENLDWAHIFPTHVVTMKKLNLLANFVEYRNM